MSVRVEKKDQVTTVILHRPEARNAVNPETARALYDAFVAFEQDPDARVAVLYGDGGVFCAGYDLKTVGSSGQWFQQLHFGKDNAPPLGPMGPTRLDLRKPVIAAIAGPAVAGGMELALWCDLRVMEESAYMGVYCRRWGVPLIDGGTVRLPRIVGQGRALDLILTGRQAKSDECLRIGLCDRVVAEGSARTAAETLALEIAQFPQECMKGDRWSARHQWGLDEEAALKQEFEHGIQVVASEAVAGAARFTAGKGRHGDFKKI
jgi:enoyl-CoA hydratase